jgi:hypothetical protein
MSETLSENYYFLCFGLIHRLFLYSLKNVKTLKNNYFSIGKIHSSKRSNFLRFLRLKKQTMDKVRNKKSRKKTIARDIQRRIREMSNMCHRYPINSNTHAPPHQSIFPSTNLHVSARSAYKSWGGTCK